MIKTNWIAFIAITLSTSVVIAQEVTTGQALKTAYALSKNASTEDEYTLIIDQISTADLTTADDSARVYANQLAAWALNRRGELRWDRMQTADDENAMAAIEDFKTSLQLDSSRWRAKQNMAFVYATRGQMKEAESMLDDVIQAKPDHANAFFNRAELRYEMGKLDAAISDYDNAIRLMPNEADFYTSRAHARFQSGQLALAIMDYRASYQLDQGNARRAIDLADAMQNVGNWREAAEFYRLANSIDAANLRGQLNLAWLLSTSPDDSIRNGQQAVQIVNNLRDIPDDEEFRYIDTYAAALAETSQFEKAVRVASTGTNIVPDIEKKAFEARLVKYKAGQPFRQPIPVAKSPEP